MVTLGELESWMSTREVANILGRSRQGVIDLAEARRIRSVKTHVGWLYDPNSVADFAAELEDVRRFDEAMATIERGEADFLPWDEAKREIEAEREELRHPR